MQTPKAPVQTDTTPPAISISLTGQHLIEASAGTGKTWTLTGIVLRLLIEAKRAPEQIICTTFTRAAAAEMRERIQARLQEFYQLLQWLEPLLANPENHVWLLPPIPDADKENTKHANTKTSKAKVGKANIDNEKKQAHQIFIKHRESQLIKSATHTNVRDFIEDPINLHLLHYLLDRVHSFSIIASVRRVRLLLVSMDKLFVGTLDSLAQKWLSEYSAETGYQQGMSISDSEAELINDIVHDQIRKFQSQTHRQSPELYQLLAQSGHLTQVTDHLSSVKQANQFICAPIDDIPSASFATSFNFAKFTKLIEQFDDIDYSDINNYFSADFRKSEGMTANTILNKSFELLPNIFLAVQTYGTAFYFHLDAQTSKLFEAIGYVYLHKDDGGKGFNKTKESNRQQFIHLPTMQLLEKLVSMTEALLSYVDGLLHRLNRDIAIKVREQLPLMLEEKNKTSFSLQMVRLNQALQGEQGAKLATYIRYHYPVALIDESQDVNGEQAKMIQSIYMSQNSSHTSSNSNRNNQKEDNKRQSFLLLVGDPKQAIYGFRGGDVANYNAMKKGFDNIMTLGMNRRSNAQLIESLNQWFDSTKPIYSELGEDIFYQHIHAHRPESRLSWQNSFEQNSFLQSNHGNNDHSSCSNDTSNDCLNDTINDCLNDSSHDNSTQTSKETNKDTNKETYKQTSNDYNNVKQKPSSQKTLFANNAVALIHHSAAAEATEENVETSYDKFTVLAKHIQYLLLSGERIDNRPITAQDIAVLVRSKSDMHKAGLAIEQLGIATLKSIETSVFSAKMAEDLLSILLAMQQPYRTQIVNRALTTSWYGLTLAQIKSLQLANDNQNANSSKPSEMIKHVDTQISYHEFQHYLHTAQKKWQNYGLLSAIQYLLSHSPFLKHPNDKTSANAVMPNGNTKPSSIWQKLAEHKHAQRYLLDLRQLLEILSTQTQGMSEQQVLDWFSEQRETKPNDDWAKQRSTPTEAGIQLMTIHKSKGLEFPIVYVLGMDSSAKKSSRAKFGFYPYIKNQQRRLSAVKTVGNIDYQAKVDQANLGEEKRIAYVALTRASEQVYVLLADHSRKMHLDYRPANIWLECADRVYQPSERLKGYVDWIEAADIIEQATATLSDVNYRDSLDSINSLDSRTSSDKSDSSIDKDVTHDKGVTSKLIDYPNYDDVIGKKYFVGWSKTSFTALSRLLDKQTEDLAISDPDYSFEDDAEQGLIVTLDSDELARIDSARVGLDNENIGPTAPYAKEVDNHNGIGTDDIRFSFVRGAGAGTFLHEVLEKMDFHHPHTWSQQIDRSVIKAGLPLAYASDRVTNAITGSDNQHESLKHWLSDVLHSSLLASQQCLVDIPLKQRKPELAFDMGLSADFRVEQINELFAKHLDLQGADKDKLITLVPKSGAYFYRYLRGEIDLVYEHAGKYYVVDYKSNYLGEHISDYNTDNLRKAMGEAGYWLQALIYQVALHRFLTIRIADYQGNEHKYLGAVEYLFLRGCVADVIDVAGMERSTKQETYAQQFGKITWDIPIELVKDMDELLGRP